VLPQAEAFESLLRNKIRSRGSEPASGSAQDAIDELGGRAWAVIHNIADYPDGIKDFLRHCVAIEF
jgi:hypothetical protein